MRAVRRGKLKLAPTLACVSTGGFICKNTSAPTTNLTGAAMAGLSRWLERVSKGWVTILAVVIFFVFTPLVLPQQAVRFEAVAGEGPSPDQSFIYSPADLYRMAEAFGAEGRAAYVRARWTFDVVWPLVYTFFLATTISWLGKRAFPAGSKARLLNLTPALGLLFDYLENICASIVMARYPAQTPVIDLLTTVFTPIKWVFVVGSFVVLAVVAVIAVAQRVRVSRARQT